MTQNELNKVLDLHKKWLNDEEGGIKADLSGANLNDANLSGANLKNTNLTNVKYNSNTSFFALQCPEKESFIAYKKVDNIIIELEVPADAKRSSATTRKCRCSKAKVIGFYDFDRNELDIEQVTNDNYTETTYRKGEMVYPNEWDDDRWNECSNGIHFFVTFDEVKNY